MQQTVGPLQASLRLERTTQSCLLRDAQLKRPRWDLRRSAIRRKLVAMPAARSCPGGRVPCRKCGGSFERQNRIVLHPDGFSRACRLNHSAVVAPACNSRASCKPLEGADGRCFEICGDAIVVGKEACDDGNTAPGLRSRNVALLAWQCYSCREPLSL